MPNFKPWLWREVRLFELRILKTIALHYSIQKWSREDVTSSNQTTQQLILYYFISRIRLRHPNHSATLPPYKSTYKSYFRNVKSKKKGKVVFDHSSTSTAG